MLVMIRLVLMNHQIAKCTGQSVSYIYLYKYIYIYLCIYTLVCISRAMLVCRSDSPLDCYGDIQLIWIKGTINV